MTAEPVADDSAAVQTFMKLLEFVVLFGASIAAGWYVRRLFSGATLPAKEVRRRLDAGDGLLLLDVRTAQEFAGELGHVQGALNLPLDQLGRRLDEAGADIAAHVDAPVVVVCRSGSRAHAAARMLRRRGLRDVKVMAGGMIAWRAAGLHVDRSVT